MSKNTKIIGVIITLVGIALSMVYLFSLFEGSFVLLIYGIPLFIIGIIILLNRKEDVIEQIKSTGGKK